MNYTLRLLGMLLLGMPFMAAAAPVLFFDFNGDGAADNSLTLAPNSSFTATLYAGNVDGVQGGLISWGVQVDFDNSQLVGDSYSIDTLWPVPGVNNVIDNAAGRADLTATTLSGGQTGTLRLFDISFTVGSATGSGLLGTSELFPGSPNFVAFASANGYNYDPEVIHAQASINVSAVPLPAAAGLFLAGLGGLAGVARRRAA